MLEEARRALRASGRRMTAQRVAVLRILQEQDGHLSASQIYSLAKAEHPRLSLSTVYRTLAVLQETGLVRGWRLDEGQTYYEPTTPQEHHHLVCLACGKVVEFECAHCQTMHERLATRHGFEIVATRVQLLGYCEECKGRRALRKQWMSEKDNRGR